MQKLIIVGGVLCFLVSCGSSIITRPTYIEPEESLKNTIDKQIKDYKADPQSIKVPALLANMSTYIKRVDYKIKSHNEYKP